MNDLILIDNAVIPADKNPALVYLASMGSANSRRAMINALNLITDILADMKGIQLDRGNRDRFVSIPWQALRFQHTQAIRAALAERVKHTTANHALSALRGVLNTAADLELMTADECRAACKLKPIKGQSIPAGRDLSRGEIIALAQVCKADETPLGARDLSIIGVLYACGLRRAELVALDYSDYDAADGKLIVRSGKGSKDRTVYAMNGTKTALDSWLAVRGQEAGPLFLRIRRGGHIRYDQHMTSQAVYNLLKSRAEQAGVKDFSPHDMRRTFVGDLLDAGADIATVAKLAGHASVITTARYDRRTEETKRKAAGLLHFPG